MQSNVVTVGGHETVATAARLMVGAGLRSLPVVEPGESGTAVIGVVSRGDLVPGLSRELLEGTRAPAYGEPSVP
jgi:CBS domain-containing protein